MDKKALFRDADGNYYTLDKDGTLHRMENGPDAAGGPLGDPEAWLIRQEPVGEVPDFLRERFDRQPPRCHAELKTIPREAPRLTAPVAPFRPAWARPAARPRSVTLGQPPRLMHRGREVTPLTVFPPDDRRVYYDLDYPWGCACKVIDPTRGRVGSGVIIGPRHVLTASHCINWSDINVTVDVLRYGTAASATTSAIAVWRYTEITTDLIPYSQVDEDYAIIVTADRIGDWFGWFGCRTYHPRWDGQRMWHNIGYPSDFGGLVPTWQRNLSLDQDARDDGPARVMSTTADLARGSSGGPMFGFWGNGPFVVAVVSAERSDENFCAGGSWLTQLVSIARDNDP